MYAGKALVEIAGYTSWQINGVIGLPRDNTGRLKRRSDLPEWVEVDGRGMRVVGSRSRTTLQTAMRNIRLRQGRTKAEADKEWEQYRKDNPNMGRGGNRVEKRRKR